MRTHADDWREKTGNETLPNWQQLPDQENALLPGVHSDLELERNTTVNKSDRDSD